LIENSMEQEQNRTEPATPFKLSEAKKRGQVAKSLDFNTMVVVWGSLLTLMIAGEGVWTRAAAVCRELTKLHEEVVRGSAAELASHFAAGARGEITVVVAAGALAEPVQDDAAAPDLDARIAELLTAGVSARDVARRLARELGLPRRAVYARASELAART